MASAWAEAYLPQLGLIIAATLLSLYGVRITNLVRLRTQRWPFAVRTALFIVIAGLGFGAMIAALAPLITSGLRLVGQPFVIPTSLAAFIAIGILAERSGRI